MPGCEALDRGNNFDTVRFLAAVAVLVSHSFPLAYGVNSVQPLGAFSRDQTNLGFIAVLVFFVISGYLITQSFDRSPVPLRFITARVLRIFPGLFVVLVLTATVLGATVTSLPLHQYFTDADTARYVYGGLFLVGLQFDLPGAFQGNPTSETVNGSLWTLWYELLMYLVVLALGVCRLLNRSTVLALWAGAMILHWLWIGGHYVEFGTSFLSGSVLYLWRDRILLDWRLALFSTVVLIGALVTEGFRLAFATFGAYLVMFLTVAPVVRLPNLARWGDLSYGIYIVAYPVQQAVSLLLGTKVTWYWNIVLSLPIVLALAWVSWHAVEKPALRLKKIANWPSFR